MQKITRTGSLKLILSILAVIGIGVAAPQTTNANPSGPTASGSYQFSLDDGYTKHIEFEATAGSNGSATGQLRIDDEAPLLDQDVDGTGDPDLRGSGTGYYVRADFDGMLVDRNTAIMSGTVTDSNVAGYVGLRVLLVVEDNGAERDQLTWGLYDATAPRWTPADAELREDDGASMTWLATDAELRDDPGIPSTHEYSITCQTFELSSFSYFDARDGAGDIQVHS